MNDVIGILTRFRLHKFAVTTDIEKAYLQIQLDEEDLDVTKVDFILGLGHQII